VLCETCSASSLARKRINYEIKMDAGICLSCPLPAETGKRRCKTCLEVASSWLIGKRGVQRRRPYRPHLRRVDGVAPVDEFDAAHVDPLTDVDRKLLAAGRCKRCHLLNPCVCLPVTAAEWQAYAGGRQ
jgi:hypothetical protein